MKIKSIADKHSLIGRRVILRTDFDLPQSKGRIKDDYRLQAALPTIKFLSGEGAKTVIVSHWGRPGGQREEKFSLAPIARRLGKILGRPVRFVSDWSEFSAGSEIGAMADGDVAVMENVRFFKEEEKNDYHLARRLARLGDLYVNDAFAVSHRDHASMSAIKRYLPAYAGLMLEKEIMHLVRIKISPTRPYVAVFGGAKLETKLGLLLKTAVRADHVLLGGKLSVIFLAALGYNPGRFEISPADIKLARRVKRARLLLPVDVVTSSRRDGGGMIAAKSVSRIKGGDYVYDIGPRTISLYSHYLKKAKTIIWNGPMGYFENRRFRHGTAGIARLVASRSRGQAYGVVGGGETVEALKMTKMEAFIDWVSTGGGAMLSFLAGDKMPGLKGIFKE